MKNFKNISFIVLMLSVLASCDGFLDINEDPNNPTEAPIEGLMINSSFESARNTYRVGATTSFFVQYLASPNQASSPDIHESISYGNQWSWLYSVMSDLTDIEDLAAEIEATDYLGAAKILKAYNLSLLVNMYGDVPYYEAFYAETFTPEYDDSETLYQEIFQLLEDGIGYLEAGGSTVIMGDDDFVYGGDTQQWIQFGHMLRARHLNHYSKLDSYDPNAVLAAIDDAFMSSADDAEVEFFEGQINPWAQVAIDNAGLLLGGWLSEQFIDGMNAERFGVFDPRLPEMTDTTDAGIYQGVPSGAGRGSAGPSGERSTLVEGDYYTSRTSPIQLASFTEMKFIEAEAALETDPDRAYDAYIEGIASHMDKLGVDPEDRDVYLEDPFVAVGSGNLTIDDVMREKYVAMFLHPEAWVDARRYDYAYEDMEIPANHNPALGGEFLRKVRYPDSELTRNSANIPEGGNNLLTRLFWDAE